jgi:microcystin-dependent protein
MKHWNWKSSATAIGLGIATVISGALYAQINVTNSAADLAGKTLITAEDNQTVTGRKRFERAPDPPFEVEAASGVVTNLDADKLDGQEGTFYLNASNINAGTLSGARFPDPLPAVSAQNLINIPAANIVGPLNAAWPVGSIFISAVSTNPNTLLGFGTWEAFATGRTLVGLDDGQSEFDTVEETGGAKTHTLTSDEMPSHTHTQNAHNHGITDPGHTHGLGGVNRNETAGAAAYPTFDGTGAAPNQTSDDLQSATTGITINNATATNQNTGGGQAHNNLQPFIVVHMWKRVS